MKTEEIDVKIALAEERWSVKGEKEAENVPEIPFKRARLAKTEEQILREKLKVGKFFISKMPGNLSWNDF